MKTDGVTLKGTLLRVKAMAPKGHSLTNAICQMTLSICTSWKTHIYINNVLACTNYAIIFCTSREKYVLKKSVYMIGVVAEKYNILPHAWVMVRW